MKEKAVLNDNFKLKLIEDSIEEIILNNLCSNGKAFDINVF